MSLPSRSGPAIAARKSIAVERVKDDVALGAHGRRPGDVAQQRAFAELAAALEHPDREAVDLDDERARADEIPALRVDVALLDDHGAGRMLLGAQSRRHSLERIDAQRVEQRYAAQQLEQVDAGDRAIVDPAQPVSGQRDRDRKHAAGDEERAADPDREQQRRRDQAPAALEQELPALHDAGHGGDRARRDDPVEQRLCADVGERHPHAPDDHEDDRGCRAADRPRRRDREAAEEKPGGEPARETAVADQQRGRENRRDGADAGSGEQHAQAGSPKGEEAQRRNHGERDPQAADEGAQARVEHDEPGLAVAREQIGADPQAARAAPDRPHRAAGHVRACAAPADRPAATADGGTPRRDGKADRKGRDEHAADQCADDLP